MLLLTVLLLLLLLRRLLRVAACWGLTRAGIASGIPQVVIHTAVVVAAVIILDKAIHVVKGRLAWHVTLMVRVCTGDDTS